MTKPKPIKPGDDFKSVAKALGCDEDKAQFEAKLGKLAKAGQQKPKPRVAKGR